MWVLGAEFNVVFMEFCVCIRWGMAFRRSHRCPRRTAAHRSPPSFRPQNPFRPCRWMAFRRSLRLTVGGKGEEGVGLGTNNVRGGVEILVVVGHLRKADGGVRARLREPKVWLEAVDLPRVGGARPGRAGKGRGARPRAVGVAHPCRLDDAAAGARIAAAAALGRAERRPDEVALAADDEVRAGRVGGDDGAAVAVLAPRRAVDALPRRRRVAVVVVPGARRVVARDDDRRRLVEGHRPGRREDGWRPLPVRRRDGRRRARDRRRPGHVRPRHGGADVYRGPDNAAPGANCKHARESAAPERVARARRARAARVSAGS